MKIQFSPDLDFQCEAIVSLVDVFEGQETEFEDRTCPSKDIFVAQVVGESMTVNRRIL